MFFFSGRNAVLWLFLFVPFFHVLEPDMGVTNYSWSFFTCKNPLFLGISFLTIFWKFIVAVRLREEEQAWAVCHRHLLWVGVLELLREVGE